MSRTSWRPTICIKLLCWSWSSWCPRVSLIALNSMCSFGRGACGLFFLWFKFEPHPFFGDLMIHTKPFTFGLLLSLLCAFNPAAGGRASGFQGPGGGTLCNGELCTSRYVVGYFDPSWSISFVYAKNGKGLGLPSSDCEPCKACKGTVIYSYVGSGSANIVWNDGVVHSGTTYGSHKQPSLDCDGVSAFDQFSDSTGVLFYGGLQCPCGI